MHYVFFHSNSRLLSFHCARLHLQSNMKFRQRMGWLFVVLFLALSCFLWYFIFELSDQYNALALDHVQTYSDTLRLNPNQLTWYMSITRRLVALPFWFWALIFGIPYLQIFCILIACTRSDPLSATIMVVPVFLCMKLASLGSKSERTEYLSDEDIPHLQTT